MSVVFGLSFFLALPAVLLADLLTRGGMEEASKFLDFFVRTTF